MNSKILEYLKISDAVSDKFPTDVKELVQLLDGMQEIYAESKNEAKKYQLSKAIVESMRILLSYLSTQNLGIYANVNVKAEQQSLPKQPEMPKPQPPKPEQPKPQPPKPEQPKPQPPKPELPKPQPPRPEPPKPQPPRPEPPKPQPPKPEPPKPQPPKPEPPKPKKELPFKVGDKFLVLAEGRNVPYTIEDIAMGEVTISGFNRAMEQKTTSFGLTNVIEYFEKGAWVLYTEPEKPKKGRPRKPEPEKPQKGRPRKPEPEKPKKEKPEFTKKELLETIEFLEILAEDGDKDSIAELKKMKELYNKYYK
jgi:hypothetical protein